LGATPAAANVPSGLVVTECRFDSPVPVNVMAGPPSGEPKVTSVNLPVDINETFPTFFQLFN
jgi:hypothetical protein